VSYGETAWRIGRVWMGWPTRLVARPRAYGRDRVPTTGGVVLAINHMHWLDIPVVGVLSPRPINFVAKIEAHRVPGLGQLIRSHGALAVRRGESDREAVRLMRQAVRDGRVLGLFVEGTRQLGGRPGKAQPGAAMVALQEGVPVVPVAVYGTQFWKFTDMKPSSVAFGDPIRFTGLPKNGRGYKQATGEIEQRILALFDWLRELHARRRPRHVTPPV
jgi:1-acyl-sn-glycerol-3-phosphate acyltransferase